MTIETSYNFRRVSDRVTTSGVVRVKELKTLGAQGYQALINLLPEASEYAVPDERSIVEVQGIEYVAIPVDFKEPTSADFARFAEAMDRVSDRKVHVHCAANFRVSAFLSMYEVSRGRWTVEQATQFIRDVWDPADHPPWPEFIQGALQHR